MKYLEVTFTTHPCNETVNDVCLLYTSYNGLVQLEVNRLADLYEVEYVKRQVAQLPQTVAAFCGSSGRSVKIGVRFARPDGTLPTIQEALLFHAHAYRLAVTCYQPMLPFGITLKEPDVYKRQTT